jgi:hypothetical protein
VADYASASSVELSYVSDVMINGKKEILCAEVALNVNACRVKHEARRFVDVG